MSKIVYKQQENSIILEFPQKNMLFYEDISFEKAENFFIEEYKNIQQLLTPKNLINFQLITDIKQESINKITKDNNFLFKGNNLLVLYTILPIFKESIKLIYIDPPYNTGNTFIYKDKFSRSLWLLFMKNRVEVAREFLQDDGVLVVQCDENEQAYLKVLLDEIYGEDSFLGMITVLTNPSGRDYKSLARTHEYLIIYGKTPNTELYPLILNKEFPFEDTLGGFELRSLRNGNVRFHQGNRPNLYYPFYTNPKKKDTNGHHVVSLSKKKGWVEIYPRESQGVQTVWRWGKNKVLNNITDNSLSSNLIARASKDSYLIFEKYRKKTRLARTVWNDKDFYTSKGTKHIKELFDGSVFDYPKPELLIARIIDITTKPGDRIIDFFLGSGTTAAVAHKSNRLWIGIEQMDYIETITIPRLQKVIAGETGGSSNHYNWTKGGSFIYSQLEKNGTKDFPFYTKLQKNNIINQL
ncbi:MAG: site-specific DNA-methyltransferase [Spirochaetota bacterium]|nr:site-specific DNA-methyltransferase [Spirochaetota bacterium]